MNIPFIVDFMFNSAGVRADWFFDVNGPGGIQNYENLDWRDKNIPKPTLEEIRSAEEGYIKFQALQEVRRKRGALYPPIGDQLDAIWKGGAYFDAMKEKILAVKRAYPLP